MKACGRRPALEAGRALDRLAAEPDDHVTGAQPGLGRRPVGDDIGDQRALAVVDAEGAGQVRGERRERHAEPATNFGACR